METYIWPDVDVPPPLRCRLFSNLLRAYLLLLLLLWIAVSLFYSTVRSSLFLPDSSL